MIGNTHNTWLTVVLIIVIIALIYSGCEDQRQLKEQIALYEASQDTLALSRNKAGQQQAEIALLVADKEKDLLKIKTQDSTLQKLQKVVKEYKGKLRSATVAGVKTADSGATVTTIIKHDTVLVEGEQKTFPVYKSQWNDKWSKGSITASHDSIIRDISIRNEFEITQGWKKQGFLKAKKPVVNILNLNPNTETQELRSFTVEPQKKRFSVGAGAMYGIDITTLKPTVVVGGGVHFTLFRL